MNIQYVSKGEDSGIDTLEVIKVFSHSESLEDIKQAVTRAKDRVFVAWSSVDVEDKDKEKIPIDEVIQTHKTFLERGGVIKDMHGRHQIGRMLAYRTMTHPVSNTVGVLTLNKVFNNYELDDEVWKEIKEGKRTGLSLGGYNMNTEYQEKDGHLMKILSGFRHTETSSVYSPANPLALNEAMSAVAKSEKASPYFVVDNVIYKVEKVGDAVVKSCESEKASESSDNVLKENKVKEDSEETTMAKEELNKSDILGVAIHKMEAGEPLSEDEKKAIKSATTKTETAKADGEDIGTVGAKDQPEDQKADDANQVDVAKMQSEIVKSVVAEVTKYFDGKLGEIQKSFKSVEKGTKVAETPTPTAGAEVTKTVAEQQPTILGNEIAKGEKKMTWTQVQQEVAKIRGVQ